MFLLQTSSVATILFFGVIATLLGILVAILLNR